MYIKHISQMYFLIEYTSAEHLVLSTLKKIIGLSPEYCFP